MLPHVELREQIVQVPPGPIITWDNQTVGVDAIVYLQVTDPKAATYEVADPVAVVEQLVITTLRSVIGEMALGRTLISREERVAELRVVFDQETARWGVRVNWVEIKAIEPLS